MIRARFKLAFATVAGVGLPLLCVGRAGAVIVHDRADRNLAPPPGLMRDAWDLQGRFSNFNATPISPEHFLIARHVTDGGGDITYRGVTYRTTVATDLPGTDLRVWTIDTENGAKRIDAFAPLWDASVDGSEAGKPMVVFGRGAPRGAAIHAPIVPRPPAAPVSRTITPTGPALLGDANLSGPTPQTAGDLRGWYWGAGDGLASWGTNVVDAVVPSEKYGELLSFDFDAHGEDGLGGDGHEATLSVGDSSGGVFIYSRGQWKLAGVNFGVDGAWSTVEPGPYANAAIFDARGLYAGSARSHEQIGHAEAAVAASSYSTRISANLAALRAVTGGTTTGGAAGDPTIVPEPATLALLAGVTLITLRRSRD